MDGSRKLISPGQTPLLDTDVLRSFIAIAENGSFTRAASQVFRTPSALSMQIKGLEEMLGERLFVREARQVRLTPGGETLLGYGRRLIKLNEEAVARFLLPPLAGTVRLGTPDDVGTRILPRVLTRFARSHSAVQVDVVTGTSAQFLGQLDAGDLDLVLVTVGNTDIDAARGEIVHTEPMVWAGLRGGIARERTPLPIALANHGCAWRAMALDALDGAGIDYRIAYVSEHCAAQAAAMQADLAIAPFPLSMIEPPLQRIDALAGLPTLGDYHVAMVRRHSGDAALDALAGHVAETFRERRA